MKKIHFRRSLFFFFLVFLHVAVQSHVACLPMMLWEVIHEYGRTVGRLFTYNHWRWQTVCRRCGLTSRWAHHLHSQLWSHCPEFFKLQLTMKGILPRLQCFLQFIRVDVMSEHLVFFFPLSYILFLHLFFFSLSLIHHLLSLSLSVLRPVYLSPSLHGDWLEAWIHHN